jgi:hypothetical protein
MSMIAIKSINGSDASRAKTRDEVFLDQQSDVVIVFWACCILPI